MSSTTDNIKNYFDAINRFYTTWFNMMQSAISSAPNSGSTKKDFNKFADWMKGQMTDLENMAIKQQQYIDNLTPEEYQNQVLSSLKDFENAYTQSSQMVLDQIKKQEEYVQSDQFLQDTKTTADRTAQVYNDMLAGFSNLVDTFTNSMKQNS